MLWNKNGLRAQGGGPWNSLLLLRVSLAPVSCSKWLAQEKGGKPCCLKWLHLLFLLFEASLLTFLPTDAQFTQVAALLNSKQVDSLYKQQGHQVSQRRENVFPNTQPKMAHFFFKAELCHANPDAALCKMPLGYHMGLAGLRS